jgi:hypothetical protein
MGNDLELIDCAGLTWQFLHGEEKQWPPEPLEDDEYEPDALGWFIGLAGDAETTARLKVRRVAMVEHALPPSAAGILRDAWDCWTVALYRPAIVLCRAVIERMLQSLFSAKPWSLPPGCEQDRGEPFLKVLIRSTPHLPPELRSAADAVRQDAKGILHNKGLPDVSQENTLRHLRNTARILERLSTKLK